MCKSYCKHVSPRIYTIHKGMAISSMLCKVFSKCVSSAKEPGKTLRCKKLCQMHKYLFILKVLLKAWLKVFCSGYQKKWLALPKTSNQQASILIDFWYCGIWRSKKNIVSGLTLSVDFADFDYPWVEVNSADGQMEISFLKFSSPLNKFTTPI